MVLTANGFADLLHVFFHDIGNCIVIKICSFAALEVNIRVLSCATGNRMLRIERTIAEFFQRIIIQ